VKKVRNQKNPTREKRAEKTNPHLGVNKLKKRWKNGIFFRIVVE
jgi:hypothetical protein